MDGGPLKPRWPAALAGGALLALVGCGEEESTAPVADEPTAPCAAPSRLVGERCLEPGVQDDGCAAGTLRSADGSCAPPGVPPERCGEGFEPDGRAGCNPILPPAPCSAGLMALPGESSCREVAPCGSGSWGDIPVDGTTVFVDQGYDGSAGPSDGSELRPFVTIGAAASVASAGAIVAIGPGSYLEDVELATVPLRLWGKCPAEVELVAIGASVGAVYFYRSGASGSELAGVTLRGPTVGVAVSGAESVALHDLWVHHNGQCGIVVESSQGPTSVAVSTALVEHNQGLGVQVMGGHARLDSLVIRDTLPREPDQMFGRGLNIQDHIQTHERAIVSLRRAVIERSHDAGLCAVASDVEIEGVVIRDTQPLA